jgi:hypothetical protein
MAFSARCKDDFQKVLNHSLKSAASIVLADAAVEEIPASGNDLAKLKLSRIMLTIAGVDFRIILLLHYRNDDRVRGTINASTGDKNFNSNVIIETGEVDSYFLEVGNRLCGEAKRLCVQSFDHLGMSTPCLLSATTTLADMSSLDLRCEQHLRFDRAGLPFIAGSIFVYSSIDLELKLEDSLFADQESTGELEFF